MGLKEKLQNLRKSITINKEDSILEEECIDLNKKVDDYINWYKENFIANDYSIDKEMKISKLRNFIEKMAVWYELRYPEAEVNKILFKENSKELDKINKLVFTENEYIKDIMDNDSVIKYLDWSDLYNTKTFMGMLSEKEKSFLKAPAYLVNGFNLKDKEGYKGVWIEISKRGFVKSSINYNFCSVCEGKIIKPLDLSCQLKNKHITEVRQIFLENGIELDDGIDRIIKKYNDDVYRRKELINCVMYRLIERDGIVGARRAFIFAKEFNGDIDIPMIYGTSTYKDGNKEFIELYLESGGIDDLVCYLNYPYLYSETKKYTIKDILEMEKKEQEAIKDSKQLKELQQRLVNVFATQLSDVDIKKRRNNSKKITQKIGKK